MIQVVCGIIYRNENIFLARRKPEKSEGGKWEFPGGKLQPNETEEQCLRRELMEEFGMQVQVGDFFGKTIHTYEFGTIELIAYVCHFIQATFEMSEHDAFRWVKSVDIETKMLSEADKNFAELLLNPEV